MSALERIGFDADYYRHERAEMLRFVPPKRQRVLEIGCSAGSFVASIPGCEEKWGVEPTDAAVVAGERLTRVFQGTFESIKDQLPARYFDVIVCNDVIEHMADHRAFLAEVKNYLTPGGMLIGSLPNVCFYDTLFRALFDNEWEYLDSGVLDRTHVSFFTTKSFRRTLEETGYRVIQIQGIWYDYRFANDRKGRFYRLLAKILGKVSLGRLSHLRHLQFAFQAVPAK
jgi:2-polyprenyl-3-methyl-5-hydroxy-6-metoxy-1,4-benzoquinol methylase